MIRMDIKRTNIFDEFTNYEQKKYFNFKQKKFLHNIDTFYYTAFLKEDIKCEDEVENQNNKNAIDILISELETKKKYLIENNDENIEIGGLTLNRKKFSIYEYCLTLEDNFDIFIAKYIPNASTPRIVVQLRSIGLWLDGCESLIEKSYNMLNQIMLAYNLNISSVRENRIDYAYHTNAIQNSFKYFADDKLLKYLNTELEIYHKIGRIGRDLTIDYFSLGNRKSNNIFVRIYNKSREVIEMGYKGFFIENWFQNGLISEFDKFCYEYAYKEKSFNALLIARCKWYLKFGKDYSLKNKLDLLLRDCSTNLKHIEEFIKGVIPDVTLITNIEFQTKRKFYYYSDKLINIFNSSRKDILKRLFQIIDNRKIFLDYLTSETLSFKNSNNNYVDWWKRLRSVKLKCATDTELIRIYANNIDSEKVKRRLIGSLASLSIYRTKKENATFIEDMSDLICALNDNDTCSSEITFVDSDSAEILNVGYENYTEIRNKKYKSLKARINSDLNSSKN